MSLGLRVSSRVLGAKAPVRSADLPQTDAVCQKVPALPAKLVNGEQPHTNRSGEYPQ